MGFSPLSITVSLYITFKETVEQDIERAEKALEEKRKDIIEKKRTKTDSDPMLLQQKIKAMSVRIDTLKGKLNE
jgi:hypothetical protein